MINSKQEFLSQTAYEVKDEQGNVVAVRDYTLPESDPGYVNNEQALADLQGFSAKTRRMIHADVMTMLLIEAGLFGHFEDVSKDVNHPARDLCLGTMKRIAGDGEFNFQDGKSKGDANKGSLDLLINTLMTDKATELTALKSACIAEANPSTKPFANATLADVLAIRTPGTELQPVYPAGLGYIIATAQQGIDVFVTLAEPAPADLIITATLALCADGADQALEASWHRQAQAAGIITIKAGETKGQLALSSRKVRYYTRVYLLPGFAVGMTATCQTNRG